VEAARALLKLVAESESPDDWRSPLEQLVRQAIADARADRVQRFFQNELFAYVGSPLVGEYRFGGHRLAQVSPNDVDLRIPVEHAVLLSFHVDAADQPRATTLAAARATDFMTALGAILGVGFYRFDHVHQWGYGTDNSTVRTRHAFKSDETPMEMPTPPPSHERGALCVRGDELTSAPGHTIGRETLGVWHDTAELLEGLERVSLVDRKRFMNAARLYRIALVSGRRMVTLRLAYEIAALDALSQGSGGSARDAVEDLVRETVPDADPGIIREVYSKVRSAHFHSGQLVPADSRSNLVVIAPFMGNRDHAGWFRLERTIWMALTEWLRGRIAMATS
jgi:hypothetical protein